MRTYSASLLRPIADAARVVADGGWSILLQVLNVTDVSLVQSDPVLQGREGWGCQLTQAEPNHCCTTES